MSETTNGITIKAGRYFSFEIDWSGLAIASIAYWLGGWIGLGFTMAVCFIAGKMIKSLIERESMRSEQ